MIETGIKDQMNYMLVSPYLLPMKITTGCLWLLPFLPLHEVLRQYVGVEIQLLQALQHRCHDEVSRCVGLQKGEGGDWSFCGTQVINVQAVPVTSLLTK